MIKTASFSKVQVFESCKFRAHIQYVQKIPEPARPLPPGKSEHYNDRGSRIHQNAEDYVRGNIEAHTPELKHFAREMETLHEQFKAGKVSLEGEWGMTRDWDPTEWAGPDTWLRLKLDALVFLSDTEAVAIDYKTGKKFGNEVKHAQQLQLYQLVTFLRYPLLEVVHTELWYTDQDDITQQTYTRSQGLRYKQFFDRRFSTMTDCTDFPANPNMFSCKWCYYGDKKAEGTGHCTKEVSIANSPPRR